MLLYHVQLALRGFRAAPALTLLVVLALGLGIGACMTTLTVYHVLSGDPIPHKSDRLFDVQIDAESKTDWKPGQEPNYQLTRFDAEALLRAGRGLRQVMMSATSLPVQGDDDAVRPLFATGRFNSADFFAMFETPLAHGSGWDAADDAARARVAVISDGLNQKLYGGGNSVGRELRLRGETFRVVGVLKPWRPAPHYFDLSMGAYRDPGDVYLPFSTAMALKFGSSGNMDCWGSTRGLGPRELSSPCAWVQYWVELASPADAAGYREHLIRYSEEQRRAGRFERPSNVRLRDVREHLVHREVLPQDVRLQVWLALGFLLVCLINTVGLLLAKTLRRSGDIGVRRALGASRGDIFRQYLIEAGTLGAAGAVLGLLLAVLGLWLVRQSPAPYAALAQMDWAMFGVALALSLAASLLAGLLPAWHAAHVAPAQHLKVQ